MMINKRTLKTFSAILTCVFVTSGLLVIIQDDQIRETTDSERTRAVDVTESTIKSKTSSPFIYLTQTEQCLTPGLIQTLELSDTSKCRCDVVILSLKTKCLEKSAPHIIYMFDNETLPWSSGRNKLYSHAMQRRLDYLYYIFLEDDINVEFSKAATPEMMRLTPISVFQDWLLDYEPAVGVGDYDQGQVGSRRLDGRIRTACSYEGVNKTTLTNPTILFGTLNAFHIKAVSHIFPMDDRLEERDWRYTDKYVNSVVESKFRGQALMFCPVTVRNLLYRRYLRG